MNRPTIDLEELLEIADEAIAEGDTEQAVAVLRQAATVAPLRRDIKNRLALVLEGTPVPVKPKRVRQEPLEEQDFSSAHQIDGFHSEQAFEVPNSGRDAISQVARKAFDAAVSQKQKVGNAKRRLSNLLQTGLDSWKSSLSAQLPSLDKKPELEHDEASASAQSMVFRPDEELQHYLDRTAETAPSTVFEDATYLDDIEPDSSSRVVRPAVTSKKAARQPSVKSGAKRPSDVEDVLAAGIGGFLDAISRVEKKKFVYAAAYTFLVGLFGYACFDVAKKFPEVTGNAHASAKTASVGQALELSSVVDSADVVANARFVASTGNPDQAINLLRDQLKADTVLQNRDMLRVELATLLNGKAENLLTGNMIAESVSAYREANSYLPNDTKLQLRFANALYYEGLMVAVGDTAKKKSFSEAEGLVKSVITADSGNLQAHRLLALLHEASNDKTQARASWQKVKSLAPKESAILTEAVSHLK